MVTIICLLIKVQGVNYIIVTGVFLILAQPMCVCCEVGRQRSRRPQFGGPSGPYGPQHNHYVIGELLLTEAGTKWP